MEESPSEIQKSKVKEDDHDIVVLHLTVAMKSSMMNTTVVLVLQNEFETITSLHKKISLVNKLSFSIAKSE